MKELPIPTLALSPASLPRGSLHPRSQAPSMVPAPANANTQDVGVLGGIQTSWAHHQDEVRSAQRLRYQVFAVEMGAHLNTPIPLHDVDHFDDFCEHLLVRSTATGEVIGTYRALTPTQAVRAGGAYSETEFDLAPLQALRSSMVELGRSCVHVQHRQGGVILALWSALYEFMQRNRLDSMMGCASIPMLHNGLVSGDVAASVWQQVQRQYMADAAWQVKARLPLPVDQLDSGFDIEPPALIKGYLRLGAKVLGAPAWDPDFNTADLPMLMRVQDMPRRYQKHFAGAA